MCVLSTRFRPIPLDGGNSMFFLLNIFSKNNNNKSASKKDQGNVYFIYLFSSFHFFVLILVSWSIVWHCWNLQCCFLLVRAVQYCCQNAGWRHRYGQHGGATMIIFQDAHLTKILNMSKQWNSVVYKPPESKATTATQQGTCTSNSNTVIVTYSIRIQYIIESI